MRRLQLVTLLALALLSAGCAAGADMRYRPAASQRAWGAKAPCFAPPVDFRFGVSAGQLVPGQDYASDWRDLSASLVEHAQAAGLSPLPARAGSREQQAEALLAEAKRRAAPLLVFGLSESIVLGAPPQVTYLWFLFGLGPGFVAMAVPMHDEHASAVYRAFVIDPAQGELLGTFTVRSKLHNVANAYSYNPLALLPQATRDALEELLGQVSQAAQAGFPKREALEDPLAFLVAQGGAGGGGRPATAPPAAAAPAGPPPFLTRWRELQEGVTQVEEVLEKLGKPIVDGPDDRGRRMLFWTHAAPGPSGAVISSSLSVFLRKDGVVDEVRFASTE